MRFGNFVANRRFAPKRPLEACFGRVEFSLSSKDDPMAAFSNIIKTFVRKMVSSKDGGPSSKDDIQLYFIMIYSKCNRRHIFLFTARFTIALQKSYETDFWIPAPRPTFSIKMSPGTESFSRFCRNLHRRGDARPCFGAGVRFLSSTSRFYKAIRRHWQFRFGSCKKVQGVELDQCHQ